MDGVTVKDPELIKGAVLNYYRDLYKESEVWRATGGLD